MAKDADARPALDADDEPVTAAAPPAANPRKRKLVLGGLIAALILAIAGAAWFFLHRSGGGKPAAAEENADAGEPAAEAPAEAEEAPAASGPPQYVALMPAFVVNLEDDEALRYLQIDIEVMVRDNASADAVKLHMPVIRNNLLLLFGQKHYADLNSREGKEKLRTEALAEVRSVLQQETGKPGVEALYFTSFVMQ